MATTAARRPKFGLTVVLAGKYRSAIQEKLSRVDWSGGQVCSRGTVHAHAAFLTVVTQRVQFQPSTEGKRQADQ